MEITVHKEKGGPFDGEAGGKAFKDARKCYGANLLAHPSPRYVSARRGAQIRKLFGRFQLTPVSGSVLAGIKVGRTQAGQDPCL